MRRSQSQIATMQWFDVPDVAALELTLFPDDAWSKATWWAELSGRPRRQYVVARSGDESPVPIVGYAGIDINGDNADVMTIAVARGHRGTGLGGQLLTRMHGAAEEAGASAMLLEVRADNLAALALYARSGYVHVADRHGYYDNGTVDAIVMRRSLIESGVVHE